MRQYVKTFAMTIALIIVMTSAAASTATASRSLSLTPAGGITANSLGLITFRTTFWGSIQDLRCIMSLGGTFNRTIGSSLGSITSAVMSPCNDFIGRSLTIAPQFPAGPWALQYNSFTGRLPSPNLVQFTIVGFRFRFNIVGVTPATGCIFSGDLPASLLLTGATPTNTTAGLIHILRNMVPEVGTPGCPIGGEFIGLFNLVQRQTLILVN